HRDRVLGRAHVEGKGHPHHTEDESDDEDEGDQEASITDLGGDFSGGESADQTPGGKRALGAPRFPCCAHAFVTPRKSSVTEGLRHAEWVSRPEARIASRSSSSRSGLFIRSITRACCRSSTVTSGSFSGQSSRAPSTSTARIPD